jgi:hypothetical protein
MINLRKTLTTASVTSLLTAAILVTASSLVTSPSRLGGIAAYAQEGESTLEIEIESASWDPRTKQVTVEFTATCSGDLSEGSWFVEVTQTRGGKVISGSEFGPGELACGEHESVTIEAQDGFFVPGPALVRVSGVVCGVDECDDDTAVEEVRLSPRG